MEKIFSENEAYINHLQSAITHFKIGQYGSVLNDLYAAKQFACNTDWKKDFGIMLSRDDDDFWSNFNIFNLCYAGTEACCSSGCCSECCPWLCGLYCCSLCCNFDYSDCLSNLILCPFECCCNCCCE